MPNGQRFSAAPRAEDIAAWRVVQKHLTTKTEAQCREVIRKWVKEEMLFSKEYPNPVTRKKVEGLYVDDAKRPGESRE